MARMKQASASSLTNWPAKPNNYKKQHCLAIMKMKPDSTIIDGWHDTWCEDLHKFVCCSPICVHKDANKTFNYVIPIVVTISIIALALVICVLRKWFQKKEEDMDADENHVYGIYQFGETDERVYSTNVAVDNNFDYE